MPWDPSAITEENEQHFSLVAAFAGKASVRTKLLASAPIKEIALETQRLDALPAPPNSRSMWGKKTKFGKFLQALVDDGSIASNAEAWSALGRTFEMDSSLEKIQSLEQFVERHRELLSNPG